MSGPRATVARAWWNLRRPPRQPISALLRETQWWPPDQLEALQLEALRDVIGLAEGIPFYADRLRRAGIAAADIRSRQDLSALPVLERDDVQRGGIASLAVPGARGRRLTTSGSTGRPVTILASPRTSVWATADSRRGHEWLGVAPGERHLYVGNVFSLRSWRSRAGRALSNVTMFHTLDVGHRVAVRRLARSLDRRPPALVAGVSNGLYALSEALLREGAEVRAGACSSGGNHLPERYRRTIERVFGCRVHQRYRSVEVGPIAHECPEAGSMHLSVESLWVEIVRDDGHPAAPGELGHVLVTTLRNRAMPLLRYRIGDLAVAPAREACACGRGLPLLGRLVGRSNELLLRPDGGYVVPELVHCVFDEYVGRVLEFQVAQRADLGLDVKVVRAPGAPVTERQIAVDLDRLLGAEGATAVVSVDEIALTGAAKLRHIVSSANGAGP